MLKFGLFGGREVQFLRVEHAGVIQTPLDEIMLWDEQRGLHRCLAGIDRRLFAAHDAQGTLGIRQLHFAVKEREHRASIACDLDMELRSANGRRHRPCSKLHVSWVATMKEHEDAAQHINRC